jgi:alpha-tubulin suppressor-like RCC1 family protein
MTAKSEALEKTVKETMSLAPGEHPCVCVGHIKRLHKVCWHCCAVDTPPAPRAPLPLPKWECEGRELKASVISAGKFHSAAVTDRGELYTWGASDGGRLGHPSSETSVTISNGTYDDRVLASWCQVGVTVVARHPGLAEFTFVTPVVCPKRVVAPEFNGRIVSDVGCSENATIAFARAFHCVARHALCVGRG